MKTVLFCTFNINNGSAAHDWAPSVIDTVTNLLGCFKSKTALKERKQPIHKLVQQQQVYI
jgi:hypothetical protein